MSIKLTDLGKKLGLSVEDLKKKFADLGISLKPNARTVDEQSAQVLSEAVNEEKDLLEAPTEKDTAKVYEEFIEKELDKEIIKSQRKMTAGKDAPPKVKKTSAKPAAAAQKTETPQSHEIIIAEGITVKEFAEKTGINPIKIIGELMKNGILANINQVIDFDSASIIADDFGIKIKRKRTEAAAEDISTGNLDILIQEKDEKDLSVRPPIVTVMGHVDHGKTKLLDAIRETDVVSTESGGITQHIGAYQIEKNGRKITFIDTPGHAAFASMRARGAKVTDIVILVVAADEGVKPQTIEALNHAKEAGVPIIVAINKIDKEDINIDRVKAQLAEQGLQPEDWGGKTIMAPVSAMTGQGIPLLLEMILLVADMENLKANANRPAVATVLEGHLDKSLGPVATILVNTGTLKIHSAFVAGDSFGRVKLMKNHAGANIVSAGPSTPVLIAGLNIAPHTGDILQMVPSLEVARAKAEQIKMLRAKQSQVGGAHSLEQIIAAIQTGKMKMLKVVLKADTLGSLEAIKQALSQIKKDDVAINVIHSGVGDISESDVMMAAASKGIVAGFHVFANGHVNKIAESGGTKIFIYQIIYDLLDDLKKLLSGLLEPQITQVTLGRAEVRAIFRTEKRSMIIGCRVQSGKIENKTKLRVFRKDEQIGEGFLDSLKRINDIVREIGEGNECGMKFEGNVPLEVGDIIESWKEERKTSVI